MTQARRQWGGYYFPGAGIFTFREKATTNPHQWVVAPAWDDGVTDDWVMYASSLADVRSLAEFIATEKEA